MRKILEAIVQERIVEERIVEERFMGANRQERWIRWYVEDDGSLTYAGCGIAAPS